MGQARDAQGRNFTYSPGRDAFAATVSVIVGGKAQTLKSTLSDRGDGTFQLMFYYGIQPERLVIEVRTKDGSVVGKARALPRGRQRRRAGRPRRSLTRQARRGASRG